MVTIIIFGLLIFLSGFFSSAETAFFSLSQSQVRDIVRKKMPHAMIVHRLKQNPQALLSTILIGNNIVNLFTASYATVVATRYFDSAALGVATGASTILILIFGEIIPKSIAYAKNTAIACLTAWPLYFLRTLFAPLIFILGYLSTFLHKILRISGEIRVTEEEVRTMARLGVEHGSIEYREHEMIENIFRFNDIIAKDVMTPLYRVTSINGDVPIEQIAYFISHDGHSRYPVYEDDEDNIIGYIHVNHVMKALNSDKRHYPLKKFLLPISIVDETMNVERVFRALKRDRSHICLLHQEGNKEVLVGILTMEDILEEIVGDIEDETDKIIELK